MSTNGTPKARRDWKPVWLQAFETQGTVTYACQAARVGRTTVYKARQQDETFALAWADLEEATTERMETEAYRRAVNGTMRDVYYQGSVVGAERQFSDVLLMFMLKSRRPEKYRDNHLVEHTGAIRVSTSVVLDDELATDARALLRRAAASSSD